MDKLEKAYRKFSRSEQKVIDWIYAKLTKHDRMGLNILRLQGHANIFRIRKGSIRIMFQRNLDGSIVLIELKRRNEKTYKGL